MSFLCVRVPSDFASKVFEDLYGRVKIWIEPVSSRQRRDYQIMNTRCIVHVFLSTVRGSSFDSWPDCFPFILPFTKLCCCLPQIRLHITSKNIHLVWILLCLYRIIRKLTAYALSVRNNTICRKCHLASIYNPSKSSNFNHFGVKGIGGIFRLLQYFSIELWDRLVIFKVLHVTFTYTID